MFAVAAPLWLLSVAGALAAVLLLPVGECAYEVPPPLERQRLQSATLGYYSPGLRDALADALANAAAADESDAEDGGESVQDLLAAGAMAAKRVKPSLSISNSLDVLRQKVMLEFVRRQLRENIKQIEMNRAHLNSIGKRGHSTASNAKDSVELQRPTRLNGLQHSDRMYRMAALHYQQQQQQQQQKQPQQQPPLSGDVFPGDLD